MSEPHVNHCPSAFRILRIVGVALIVFVFGCCTSVLCARNIFDDDWTPPKPVTRVHQDSTQPSGNARRPGPTSAPSPAGPEFRPPTNQTPSVTAPERLAIPSAAEQAHSRALLKAAFSTQLKDKSAEGRATLARALLEEAPKTTGSPSDEYVVLGGAIQAAQDAGDLDLCFQAADLLASRYQIDAMSIKTDAAIKASYRSSSPVGLESIRAALDLVDPLLAAENFAARRASSSFFAPRRRETPSWRKRFNSALKQPTRFMRTTIGWRPLWRS